MSENNIEPATKTEQPETKISKKFPVKIIVVASAAVLLLIIIASILFLILNRNKSEVETGDKLQDEDIEITSTPTPSPTPPPTSTEIPEQEDSQDRIDDTWLTYENDGIKFKYPPEFVVKDEDLEVYNYIKIQVYQDEFNDLASLVSIRRNDDAEKIVTDLFSGISHEPYINPEEFSSIKVNGSTYPVSNTGYSEQEGTSCFGELGYTGQISANWYFVTQIRFTGCKSYKEINFDEINIYTSRDEFYDMIAMLESIEFI
ncbi:MAG TPA: hypothetical protein VGA67_04395 [Candidatus Dojkabacteria bacterium]|jgi:hypothetical protein